MVFLEYNGFNRQNVVCFVDCYRRLRHFIAEDLSILGSLFRYFTFIGPKFRQHRLTSSKMLCVSGLAANLPTFLLFIFEDAII